MMGTENGSQDVMFHMELTTKSTTLDRIMDAQKIAEMCGNTL